MKIKRFWRFITYIVPVLLFLILFHRVSLYEWEGNLKNIDMMWLLIAVINSILANIFLSSLKWQYILKGLGLKLNYSEILFIRLGSIALKTISPAKTGSILRAVYLKKNFGFSMKSGIISVILDILMNLWAIIIIFLIFAIINSYYISYALISLLFINVFSYMALFKKSKFREYISIRLFKKDIFNILNKINYRKIIFAMFLSLAYMSAELINLKILCNALNIQISVNMVFLLGAMTVLISNIPVTLHGFGTREASICYLFRSYAPYSVLLSLGLIFSLVEYLSPVFIGLFFTRRFLKKLM